MNKHFLIVLARMAVILVLAALSVTACIPPGVPQPAAPAAAPTVAPTVAPAAATTAPEPTPGALVQLGATPTPDTRPVVPAPPADGSRPLAQLSPQERNDRFSGPAAKATDPETIYLATIVTDKGNIVAELYKDAPEGVNNFVTLAQNGFYDGLTFHRVEPGFVIQGGDPAGNGSGGPGYTIPAEIHHRHLKGALAWARTGDQVNPERRSSGSQFYITLEETAFLDGGYSVFGQVIEGMDVAEKIAVGDKIQKIDISKATVSRMPTPAPTPTPNPPVAQAGRPLAAKPLAEREGIHNAAPAMTLDPSKTYQATIETALGNVVVDLDVKNAPLTVNNFVVLADLGFYDEMPIAAVYTDTMFITGSPARNPASDVGYTLALEPTANASTIVTGTIGMYPVKDPATGNPVASGSQFFLSLIAQPEGSIPLNLFGKVSEGLDVARKLTEKDVIKKITITAK